MKILVVEDSLSNSERARAILEREHDVRVASTARSAVAFMRGWKPDVVMIDMLVPWDSTGRDEQKPFFHGMTIVIAALKWRVPYVAIFAEGQNFTRFCQECLDIVCVDEERGGYIQDSYYISGKTEAGVKNWQDVLDVIARLPKSDS